MDKTLIPSEENITRKLLELGVDVNDEMLFAYKCGFVDGGVTREEYEELRQGQRELALKGEQLNKQAEEALKRADFMIETVELIKELKAQQ